MSTAKYIAASAEARPIELPPLPENPLVSVLIANYNYANYLAEALDSLRAQTYGNWEAIVCDDGSTDASRQIMEEYASQDRRIRYLFKENGGQASALNAAFGKSQGQVVCILDADDTFARDKLRAVVAALAEDAQCGLVFHHMRVIDRCGNARRLLSYAVEGYLAAELDTLWVKPLLPPASGICVRREVVDRVFPLPAERFRSVADGAIVNCCALLTAVRTIPRVLASYRIHSANLSGMTSTNAHLDLPRARKTLTGMEQVLQFVNEFAIREGRPGVDVDRVRPVVEHRILIGVLSADRALVRSSLQSLRQAYREVRRDYPATRMWFWRLLGLLPTLIARRLLAAAFKTFSFSQRIASSRSKNEQQRTNPGKGAVPATSSAVLPDA